LNSLRTKSAIVLVLLLAGMLTFDLMNEKVTASALASQNPAQTLEVTTLDAKNVTLTISGNVSVSQITDIFFENLPNWYNNTNIRFQLRGLSGSAAFMNITIPKSALLEGTEPVVNTNGINPMNDGFTQDNENFYVWFTTHPLWDNSNVSDVGIIFLLATSHQKLQSAYTQTLTVSALGTQKFLVMLDKGEVLSGDINGETYGHIINFEVTDPSGKSVLYYNKLASEHWSFVAQKNGTYTLTVSNSSPVSTSNDVILEYTFH
jgi:hypothetical protein